MHRAFAAWLTDRPWRAALATICLVLLAPQGFSPLSAGAAAVAVLVTLRKSARAGIEVAGIGVAAQVGILIALGLQPLRVLALVAATFAVPSGLALLLRSTSSLRLCFQVAVLAAAVFTIGINVVLDDPGRIWEQLLRETAATLAEAGLEIDEEAVVSSLGDTVWGSLIAIALVASLSSLFLGRWWQSLLEAPGAFGAEFRQLRLGLVLGALATVNVAGALWLKQPTVDALAWTSVTAFAFQGLAAAHRRRASGRLGRGWLAAIYVLLVVPVSSFLMAALLAGWGFVDNWRRARPGTV